VAWDRDTIKRLIEVEAKLQDVDPRLAVAVAMQESGLRPDTLGDRGKSRGVFHLQERAAIDAGIDPKQRDDPAIGIFGGVRYLKQQLDKSGGHIPSALSRYNRGTPEYRGIGDPDYVYHVMRHYPDHPLGQAPTDQEAYRARLNKTFGSGTAPEEPRQQPGLMARVSQAIGPARADAATPPVSGRSRLEEIEAELARREGQQAPGGTQAPPPVSQAAPPPATQPGASQGPPTPDPSWTPGMRFQALPSIQQLAPADRMQKTRDFERLKPDLQEEFLRSEEPTAGGLAMGGGPVQQAPPVTDPAALLAVGKGAPSREQPAMPPGVSRDPEARAAQIRAERAAWEQHQGRPWREGDPLMPTQRAGMAGATSEAPLEEQNPAQKWIDTALDVGYGAAGAVLGGATAGIPGMIAGPTIAQGALDRARMHLGMRPQEKAVFELGPVNVYQSDLLNAGFSLLLGTPDIVKSVLSKTQAGRAIRAADEATRAAHQAWQGAAQEARAAQQAGRREAYQAAERKVLDAQARYQQRVQAREQTIATNQQTYDDALAQYKQEVQQSREQAYRQEAGTIAREQAGYQQQVRGQAADVAAQGQAIQSARAVPGRYTPETPSWVLYEKFGDAAKDATVDLAPARAALAEVRASRGVLPDGTVRPFPAQVESIAANLEKATGETSLTTIREELRRLGPLTRSQDGNVRGAAKQLYGVYADVLEASPVANDLLRQANATFRKEMALQDVSEWLRPGHGIVRIDQQGRQTINVGALMTRLEKQISDDSLFRGAFSPDELQALRQDVGRLAGTPRMPTRTPQAPQPALLPGSAPEVAARLRQPPEAPGLPAEVPRPRVEALPGGAGPGRRMPDVPTEPSPVTPRQALGERPAFAGPRAGTWGAILASMTAMGVPASITATTAAVGAAHVTQRQARWLLSNALLDPKRRGLMQAAMDSQGRLDRRVYGVMKATLSPAEKRQYLRETQPSNK
jgi:hypothetical protein